MAEAIKEGDYVVLVKVFDSGNMKIIPVIKDSTVYYGKLRFNPKALIDSTYGTIFEIKGDKMIKVENFEDYDNELTEVVSEKMSTFNEKSQFSQEKIVRKKKRKCHANIVTVIKPTLVLLNEMLFARDKIGGLRVDILAQILTLSNVQNGSKCLVLDHNLGLITSAVASRILPQGVCIHLLQDYEVLYTARKTMNMLNIREADWPENILSITIRDMYKIFKGVDRFEYEDGVLQARADEQLSRLAKRFESLSSEPCDATKRVKLDKTTHNDDQVLKDIEKKDSNRINRHRERALAAKHLKERSLDSLILVVQNDHPLPLVKLLFPFLAPSRQFVIYSDITDSLIECQQYLKSNSLAVSLQLSQSWMRKYQVLPDRTRPEMNATGYGGFLLSGTKAHYGSANPN
jgi:tRNA (adenine-N(1)-)-methyltransferase non-catalytic subunit